jgi:hypothetical protein
MSTTRRGFLTRAALAGGALVLPGGGLLTSVGCAPGEMARRTNHYFIFYFMMGGWDLVLHTDPVPAQGDTVWIPYDKNDVIEVGAHKLGPTFKPLVPFVDKMAILRGIYVDALNHPQARIRMCTGRFKPPGPRPTVNSIQAIIAEKVGAEYEIPNLSSDTLRPSTFRGDGADERLEPLRVASVEQLRGMVGWKGDVGAYRRDIERALRAKDEMFARDNAEAQVAQDFRSYANLARDALDSSYPARVKNIGGGLPGESRTSKNARLAVEAVRQDLAPVITVGSGEFDSHTRSQYASHQASVLRGMRTVAEIAQGLEDHPMPGNKTLLDHTTIVVTSEFSRDPTKNELGGKHHWSANSMIFIGKGIRRSRGEPTIVGACDDGVNPIPMNPDNGSFKRGTELIEMQHGLASILAMIGVDPYPHFGAFDPIVPLLA